MTSIVPGGTCIVRILFEAGEMVTARSEGAPWMHRRRRRKPRSQSDRVPPGHAVLGEDDERFVSDQPQEPPRVLPLCSCFSAMQQIAYAGIPVGIGIAPIIGRGELDNFARSRERASLDVKGRALGWNVEIGRAHV